VHVLSVSSLKGGVGKTTVALGVASAAYARGLRTLVVDLDPQCDATTGLGAIGEFNTTCADVLRKPRHNIVHNAIVASSWAKIQPAKIDIMVGSPSVQLFDEPSPSVRDMWRLEIALSRVEDEYDLVIIDTPPSINALTKTAWVASDRIIVVTEPSLFSVVAADRSIRAINDLRKEVTRRLKIFGVVINRYKPLSREHQFRVKELNEKYPGRLLPQKFEEKSTIQQAQGAARPIHSWPGETAKQIATYFDQILDALLLDLAANVYDESEEKSKRTRREKKLIRTARGKKKIDALLAKSELDPIELMDSASLQANTENLESADISEAPADGLSRPDSKEETIDFDRLVAEAATEVDPDEDEVDGSSPKK
jgi:cellulose biosynthesis protein BcsQ